MSQGSESDGVSKADSVGCARLAVAVPPEDIFPEPPDWNYGINCHHLNHLIRIRRG
jgi:hypothetical protein